MKIFRIILSLASILLCSVVYSQEQHLNTQEQFSSTCTIKFEASTSIADLEQFAKCFKNPNQEFLRPTFLQTNEIDFKKLSRKITQPSESYQSIENVYGLPVIQLGDYNNFENRYRASNLAFYEANRNSVLSAGYVIYPGTPRFGF